MKLARVKRLMVLMLAVVLCAGCARHGSGAASQPTTQTIAPADAQPAPNGTDTMTQTVDVDDSRSESDGMTASDSAPAPAKTAPGKSSAKTPAKKKGHK